MTTNTTSKVVGLCHRFSIWPDRNSSRKNREVTCDTSTSDQETGITCKIACQYFRKNNFYGPCYRTYKSFYDSSLGLCGVICSPLQGTS